jgi:hypothetical protein
MAFLDDVVDGITPQIVKIGLSRNGSTEITDAGYVRLAPSYGASSSGVADLTATLEFDGELAGGNVTHLIFYEDDGGETIWVIRPADDPESFNSDGRLDLTSAPVTADFPA